MKTGGSSLNPYAACYVPVSKRGAANGKNDFNSAKKLANGSENVWNGHQPDNASTRGQQQNFSQVYVPKLTDHHAGQFYPSSSQYPNEMPEKSNFDQEFMDLAYLQINFPGLSEDSLSDVYLASRCDLDASVDMLNQLELYPDDTPHMLPDTLDIGDVQESGTSHVLASQESRNLKPKSGPSTSG